ncbi:MAG: NfeD family protein [Proteobacteria bacterium]|nr:NfeD family protein [Pseudomonadota bacterium]
MKDVLDFLVALGPQHWLVFGLILLIAEMATGTTYILWPAVAALITSLMALIGVDNGFMQIAIFAALTVLLTAFGHPIVKRWREARQGRSLNERAAHMVGTRGVLTAFANGVGAMKINDSIWRAESEEPLTAGEQVEVASVHGATVKVRRPAAG